VDQQQRATCYPTNFTATTAVCMNYINEVCSLMQTKSTFVTILLFQWHHRILYCG